MAEATTTKTKPKRSKPSNEASSRPHLPDPAASGPYRPFTTDPGRNEAWWWLGLPLLCAVCVFVTWQVAPGWYTRWVIPEGYGVLEFSQFVIVLIALALAVRLLFNPFVRQRPFVRAVTLVAALSCLYIAGEETSWGQHFFHWNTPEYWADVNRQEETNLHNTYAIFEKWPRAILELGVFIGGLLVPLAAAFDPRVRANRFSLFLPPAALVPAALGTVGFKLIDMLYQRDYIGELLQRPSEVIENYLYFFVLAYLIVFTRRIHALEAQAGLSR